MARIAGVNIPNHQHAEIALTAEIHATFTDALGLLFPEARTRVFTAAQMKAASAS